MPSYPQFHRTELLVGTEAQRKLAQTRVIVFGVGGVGSWCAEALVRSGVLHLTIVDSDAICTTNINRQLQATSTNIGRSKVFELQRRLLEVFPQAEVEALEKVIDKSTRPSFDLGRYDYVIDAIDSLSNKLGLIEYALETGSRLYSSMGASAKLDPTRIKVSSIWKTEVCPLAMRIRKRLRRHGVSGDFLCVFSDERLPNHPIPPACGTDRCFCPRFKIGDDGQSEPAHEWCSLKASINGSVVHITAIFGMMLAGLVVQDVVKRAYLPIQPEA